MNGPTIRQLEGVRLQLHTAVDRCCDAWSWIADNAGHRGWPNHTGGGGGSGPVIRIVDPLTRVVLDAVPATAVEVAAFTPDPWHDWLLTFAEARAHLFVSDNGARVLSPPNPKAVRAKLAAVERCIRCGLEVGTGTAMAVHRVNGWALCRNTCYYVLYRRTGSDDRAWQQSAFRSEVAKVAANAARGVYET